jgi:hypothetical protein
MTRKGSVILVLVLFAAIGCVSSGGDEPQPQQKPSHAEPPLGSPLAKIELGMSDEQVRAILGSPDSSNAYTTGKAWIPFYFAGDTARSDWMYKGVGRVVFSRNRYSGALKVIRLLHNPDELQ